MLNSRPDDVDRFTGSRQGLWAVFTAFTARASTTSPSGPITSCSSSGYCCSAARSGGCWQSSRRSRSATASRWRWRRCSSSACRRESSSRPSRSASLRGRGQPAGRDRPRRPGRGWRSFFRSRSRLWFRERPARDRAPARAWGCRSSRSTSGVEIGQAVIVVIVPRRWRRCAARDARSPRGIAIVRSSCVMIAGAFWFVRVGRA